MRRSSRDSYGTPGRKQADPMLRVNKEHVCTTLKSWTLERSFERVASKAIVTKPGNTQQFLHPA